jgi:hypothetical protein
LSPIKCTASSGTWALKMIEKAQELLMPMARPALKDDCAVEHIERSE